MRSVRVIVAGAICLALILGFAFADIWPLGEPIPNSLLAGITSNGFNFMSDLAEVYLENNIDIIQMIEQQNPLYSALGYDFNAVGGSYDPIQLQIQLTPFDWMNPPPANALYIRAVLPNFVLEIDISSKEGLGANQHYQKLAGLGDGKGDIDVHLTGRFEASLNLTYVATPTPHLEASFTYLDVFLDSFSLSCGGWSWLCNAVGTLFEETVRGMLRSEIADQIYSMVNDMLAQLPLLYQVEIDNPFEEGEVEVLDFSMANFLLQTAPSRNVATFVLESALYFEGTDECVDLGGNVGSLYTPSSPPEFSVPSPGGHSYHIVAAISDDMVNQLLYSAYATGLLCISMNLEDIFPTGKMPEEFHEFAEKVGEEEGLFWILTYPRKEPIFTVGGPGGAYFTIDIEDFDVAIYTYLCERWARFLAATIGFTASGTFSVSIDTCDTGPCTVVTVDLPSYELSLDITYSELSGLDEDIIKELIDTLLEQYMDDLLAQYGRIEVPALELPGGIYLLGETVDILPIGSSEDFLGIYANFVTAK